VGTTNSLLGTIIIKSDTNRKKNNRKKRIGKKKKKKRKKRIENKREKNESEKKERKNTTNKTKQVSLGEGMARDRVHSRWESFGFFRSSSSRPSTLFFVTAGGASHLEIMH